MGSFSNDAAIHPGESRRAVRILALLATLATFVLLIAGATVSATGAGLACPDWPLCNGRVIPPLDRLVLIEYGHRLLASGVGAMMLALAVLVWRRARGLMRLMVVLLILLAAQVGLGGATVLSALKPIVVGTHLLTAMTFLGLLVVFTARAYWETGSAQDSPTVPAGLRRLVHVALGVALLQIALGGFVSAFGAGLACPDFPLCNGRIFPGAQPIVLIHAFHRLVAFTLLVAIVVLAATARASDDRLVRTGAAAAVLLVIVQVTLGAFNVWTRLDATVRIAHLAGAAALLGTLSALLVRVRLSREAPAAARRVGATRSGWAMDYLSLTKPRIIVLLLVTTITTMVVAAGGAGFGAALAVYTLLGGAMAAGAANAINCYWDRDIDAVMRRTRGRPVPSGRVAPRRALVFGIGLGAIAVGMLGLLVNWLSALLAAAGIVFYVGVYTVWLKRNTPQNIVIGGAAGAI
ncbi:MAG TPA: COX15/CtaA family protein, partial [bacterium]|nr:COX15/CtaA family protein [bacterium]